MDGSVYEYQPSFILGFHGCQRSVGEAILGGQERHLKPSEQKWGWLGHGIYFWEGNLTRVWEWARARKAERKIDEPFVIGAIIDLRHCLDLFDREAMRQVSVTHKALIDALMNFYIYARRGSAPIHVARRCAQLLLSCRDERFSCTMPFMFFIAPSSAASRAARARRSLPCAAREVRMMV